MVQNRMHPLCSLHINKAFSDPLLRVDPFWIVPVHLGRGELGGTPSAIKVLFNLKVVQGTIPNAAGLGKC